jgi:hypothetical protein
MGSEMIFNDWKPGPGVNFCLLYIVAADMV